MTIPKAKEPDAPVEPRSVQEALALIIGELPGIGKNEQMGSGSYGYQYRGIETITRHVQPLLAKYGVVIVPRATLVSVAPALDQKPGWQDTVLSVEWLIVGPDGSTIEASTIGIGRDNSDKGANKAQSQAFKYLLLQLLCISDSKDDGDGHDLDSAYAEVSEEDARKADAILALFEQVKAAKGTPMEQGLKDLAARNERELKAKAFADDPDWAAVVHTFITGEETT